MITERQFNNTLQKIMDYNNYPSGALTTEKCDQEGKWTPTDLILREYYNNGGGSAKGFLGITSSRCLEAYLYIKAHQEELRKKDYYNKDGFNNWGFRLWSNYNVH